MSDIFGFLFFANGNKIVFGRRGYSTTARPCMGKITGSSITDVFVGSNVTNDAINSAIKFSDTEAVAISLTGLVYRTSNSGDTWILVTNVGSGVINSTIGKVGGFLFAFQNSWIKSVDGGLNWTSYTTAPTITPYRHSRNYGDYVFIGSYNTASFQYSKDGVIWNTVSYPTGNRVNDVTLSDDHVFIGTTGPTGVATVYRSEYSVSYSGQLKIGGSNSGSPIVNTSGAFGYTKAVSELSDTNTYTMEVTNLVSTVSDSLAVVVGVASVALPMSGHTCEIAMAWDITNGHNDNFYVYDMGAEYDVYTAEVDYITDDVEYFTRGTVNVPIRVTNHSGGFYPFGCHLSTEVDGYRYMTYDGKLDLSAKWHGFKMNLVPESDFAFSYNPYTWSCQTITGFNFGVLTNFPVPTVEGSQKANKFYNRQSNNLQEYDLREATEYREVKLNWEDLTCSEQSALCSYILTGVRATQISVLFPEMMAPWKSRTGETWGNFNVKLSSEKIKLKQSAGNLWSVEIEVKKCP